METNSIANAETVVSELQRTIDVGVTNAMSRDKAYEMARGHCAVFTPDRPPVRKPVTLEDKADRQLMMYKPCKCGSGKKYRFCCFKRST